MCDQGGFDVWENWKLCCYFAFDDCDGFFQRFQIFVFQFDDFVGVLRFQKIQIPPGFDNPDFFFPQKDAARHDRPIAILAIQVSIQAVWADEDKICAWRILYFVIAVFAFVAAQTKVLPYPLCAGVLNFDRMANDGFQLGRFRFARVAQINLMVEPGCGNINGIAL